MLNGFIDVGKQYIVPLANDPLLSAPHYFPGCVLLCPAESTVDMHFAVFPPGFMKGRDLNSCSNSR